MVVGIINKEVAKYTSRPEVVKKRVLQNKARRMLAKEGLVHKGDGKDVDHKRMLSKGGTDSRNNLRVRSAHDNRSFSRRADGSALNNITKSRRK